MPKRRPPSLPSPPPATLVDVWTQGEDWRQARYEAYRKSLPLEKRLAELLWSFPFLVEHLPVHSKEALRLEEEYGDGEIEQRRELQMQAFSSGGARRVKTEICLIGEEARDARRRDEIRNGLLAYARQYSEETKAIKEWVRKGRREIAPVVAGRTKGLVSMPDERLRAILDELRSLAEGWEFMLPRAKYRHSSKQGRRERPWVNTAREKLRKLGLRRDFIDFLLIAWCLKVLDER